MHLMNFINKTYNKCIKNIRSRSLGQPKAVLRTFLAAPYANRYISLIDNGG